MDKYIMNQNGLSNDNIENFNKETKINQYNELSERDFYPPQDDRVLESGVDDIDGGDNFLDYSDYFFDTYEDDLFDNN